MKAKQGLGHGHNAQRLAVAAVSGCVLVPIIFLALVKSNSHQFAILSLQLSIHTYGALSTTTEEEGGAKQTDANLTSLQPLQLRAVQERNDSIMSIDNESIKFSPLPPPNEKPDANSSSSDIGVTKALLEQNEKQDDGNTSIIDILLTEQSLGVQNGNRTVIGNNEKEVIQVTDGQEQEQNYTIESFNSTDESSIVGVKTEPAEKQSVNKSVIVTENTKQDQNKITVGNNAAQESKLECDLSGTRSDTCTMLGDIRVISKSSTIIISSPLPANSTTTAKIRPYARKWESPVMEHIKEVSITPSSESGHVPPCSVQHSVPAVIFSTGGFLGNFFHDFTDVLVPLFATSRQFQGEVQFLVTDYDTKWIAKYKPILKRLSHHEIIDMDSEAKVHCFPKAQLGLLSHRVLGMDPSKTPNGYSMLDFKQFLRSCFSLKKGSTNPIPKKSRKKPRLLIILRRGSRSLTNAKEVVAAGRSVGFKVVTAGPEDTKDLARFAKNVNSADVMVGVHGAGLANMVFLPTNASLVQIIPWGGLKWASWHDFGEPAPDMGLNYVEYEIKEEESSLIEEYPRDHAVFRDPMSIHRQGWNQLWSIFLNKQKVKLDVGRFRDVLLEIYQSLKN